MKEIHMKTRIYDRAFPFFHLCFCLGGVSHWHVLGCFFAKFSIAIGEVFISDEEAQIKKLGVFYAIYCKKQSIWAKFGAFLSKMVYWWVGNWAKNWYRESQIFKVWQAHPRTILVRVPPSPPPSQVSCKKSEIDSNSWFTK